MHHHVEEEEEAFAEFVRQFWNSLAGVVVAIGQLSSRPL